jgi:hypothetical protein
MKDIGRVAKECAEQLRTEWKDMIGRHELPTECVRILDYVADRFDEGPITHDKLKALGFVDAGEGLEWRLDRGDNPPIDSPIDLTFYDDTSEGVAYGVWVGEWRFRVKTMKQLRDVLAAWGIE